MRSASGAHHARGYANQRWSILPLPRGEGRGEGEPGVAYLKAAAKVSGADNFVGSLCRNLCRIGHSSTKASTKFAKRSPQYESLIIPACERHRVWTLAQGWKRSVARFAGGNAPELPGSHRAPRRRLRPDRV